VNLTTLDDECPDDECVLGNADYAWIRPNHPTAVAFSRARIWDLAKLEAAIKSGLIKIPHPDMVPNATVLKVAAIAVKSVELRKDAKRML
jgi:hypothetical protein